MEISDNNACSLNSGKTTSFTVSLFLFYSFYRSCPSSQSPAFLFVSSAFWKCIPCLCFRLFPLPLWRLHYIPLHPSASLLPPPPASVASLSACYLSCFRCVIDSCLSCNEEIRLWLFVASAALASLRQSVCLSASDCPRPSVCCSSRGLAIFDITEGSLHAIHLPACLRLFGCCCCCRDG